MKSQETRKKIQKQHKKNVGMLREALRAMLGERRKTQENVGNHRKA